MMYLSEFSVIFLLLKISEVLLRDDVSNQVIRNGMNGKRTRKPREKIENLARELEEDPMEYDEERKLPSYLYCYDKSTISNMFDPSASSESFSDSSSSGDSPRKRFNYLHFECSLSRAIHTEEIDYFMSNLTEAFRSISPSSTLDSLLAKWAPIFRDTNFFVVDRNFVLGVWHPLQDDIRGLAVRKSSGKFVLTPMYKHQVLNDSHLDDVVIGGYIPGKFLRKLTYKSNIRERRKLYVVMIVLIGNHMVGKFTGEGVGVEAALGVSFPGYCKKNYSPMVKLIFRNSTNVTNWTELGQDYHDTDSFGCLLDKISYFAPLKNLTYFESVKANYCLKHPINGRIYFQQTPSYEDVFPEEFCMNDHLEIPIYKCMACNTLYDWYNRDANCSSHVTSEKTDLLYREVTECYLGNRCYGNMSLLGDPSLSYVDIKLLFLMAKRLMTTNSGSGINVSVLSNMLDEGLRALSRRSGDQYTIVYVSNFLSQYLFCLRALRYEYRNKIVKKSTFVHQNFNAQSQKVIGLALYEGEAEFKDYAAKTLTLENVTTSTGDIEIYLDDKDGDTTSIIVDLFVIDGDNFAGNDTDNYKTKIVAIQHNFLRPVSFRIFWKHFNEITIPVNNTNLILVYISEHYNYSTCRTIEQLILFEAYTVSDLKYTSSRYESIEISDLMSFLPLDLDMAYFADGIVKDILSQISITVNPKAGIVFHEHCETLRMIKYACTALSCLGVALIAFSAIFFKHWYKKRFYTVQLTVAIACQTIFYLLKSDKINRVGYLFFSYSLLAQFFWIMLIGYSQYKRFIKIFHFSDVSNAKSLIIGWLGPALITVVSLFKLQWITKCSKCSCSKTYKQFPYAIFVPIYLIIICNVVNYIAIMVNVYSSAIKSHGGGNRNKKKAAIMLLFLLGIPWTSIFALRTSWSWLILLGWYLFYIVAPLQGFTLFVFVVAFDKNTRNSWIYFFSRR